MLKNNLLHYKLLLPLLLTSICINILQPITFFKFCIIDIHPILSVKGDCMMCKNIYLHRCFCILLFTSFRDWPWLIKSLLTSDYVTTVQVFADARQAVGLSGLVVGNDSSEFFRIQEVFFW